MAKTFSDLMAFCNQATWTVSGGVMYSTSPKGESMFIKNNNGMWNLLVGSGFGYFHTFNAINLTPKQYRQILDLADQHIEYNLDEIVTDCFE